MNSLLQYARDPKCKLYTSMHVQDMKARYWAKLTFPANVFDISAFSGD